MHIEAFFDKPTWTFTFVVVDKETKKAAIIDPVLDYDPDSGRTSTTAADKVIDYIEEQGLDLEWILETHAHADHLTGSFYIKNKLGGKTGIGRHITEVMQFWIPIFGTEDDTDVNGSQFDALFDEGDVFKIGNLDVTVMYTPGHTPACATYLIEDAAFVGDTIFMPRMGTARADFPGGDARTLYRSIQKLLALPDQTKLYVCHDYPPEGQSPEYVATVADHKANNIMVGGISEDEYVKKREARDKTLSVPRLILPSIQVNMRAGSMGKSEANGIEYIKIPVNKI